MNIEKINPIAFIGKWIDLTHDLTVNSLSWPESPRFELESLYEGPSEEGDYLNIHVIKCFEQCGTHMDAPLQMIQDGIDAGEIALSSLITEGVKIDMEKKVIDNPDYQITEEDLVSWEQIHGTIPHHCCVLFHTGYAKYWPNKDLYWGIKKDMEEIQTNLHFPGLHPDAAKWLISKRRPASIGIDTSSIDYGQAKRPLNHLAFLKNDIVIFQNLAAMHELPETGFLVVALPMKIRGASGAPLRITACIP